jgi:hypothetical protein
VGETSNLRPIITAELGDIPLAPGPGHDGQIFYAIGLDLDGDVVGPLLDHAGYRYRRILFPLMSSAVGLLDGYALLNAMIVVAAVSMGAASGAVAAMAARAGGSPLLGLTILLNPGVWLSVRLLTSDVLALALMAIGLFCLAISTTGCVAALAMSTLAKDAYLVTPAGLGVSRDRRRWVIALVPTATLLAWMTWVTFTLGDGFTGRENLTWPFVGIVDASASWAESSSEDLFYLVFALLSVTAGLVTGCLRRSWLRWPILGWSVLGVVSSDWVWEVGNNAARAFAPILVLVALSLVVPDPTHRPG